MERKISYVYGTPFFGVTIIGLAQFSLMVIVAFQQGLICKEHTVYYFENRSSGSTRQYWKILNCPGPTDPTTA